MISFSKSFSSNIYNKYTVQSAPQFSTGCWSVYDAKNKSTNEPVSVLVLSKKTIARLMSRNGVDLRQPAWEEIKDFAMRGVHELTKIRHPSVVRIVEPLESGKGTLTFVTERLVSTVEDLHESDSDELSVVRGLTSIIQASKFSHTSVGMVHMNVTPESITVDSQGDWKLMGFEFLTKFEEFAPGSYYSPQRDTRLPRFMHPPYDYLAPEIVSHQTVAPASDVWGIAAVSYTLYMRSSPLKTRGNPNAYREEYSLFRSRLSTQASKFPVKLRPYSESLFSDNYEGRITLEIFETTDFLQNPLIKALKGIDEYAAKPLEEKVAFLKHLQGLLTKFPKQMRSRKIVKFAVAELSGPREPSTGQSMGNTLFTAAHDMSSLSFSDQVLPLFSSLATYLPFQESVATNIEIMAKSTSDKDFSKSVLPLLVDALKHHDAQHVSLQTQISKKSENYAKNLTVPKTEQLLFPTVIDCFAATPARVVKVAATECLRVLVERGVSKALIADRLIPASQAMKTRDPNVVMAVAVLWKTLSPRLSSQQIFTLALPHLSDLASDKDFTTDQFVSTMNIIQEQIDTVKKSQLKILANNKPQDEDDWSNESGGAAIDSSGAAISTTTTPVVDKQEEEAAEEPSDQIVKENNISSFEFDPLESGPSGLLSTKPVLPLSKTAKQIKKSQPSPKTPAILPPPVSTTLTPQKPAITAASVQTMKPVARTESTTTNNTSAFTAPMMAPLVPSNKTAPNSNSAFMSVMQPTPLKAQPVSKSIPSSDSVDDFGDFTSSKQVDSLI